MNIARKYWETCRSNYAHLKVNWEIFPDTKRIREIRKIFFDKYKLENKIVIDYGCGAGWLGLYLFENHNIGKYIGVDIADRSIMLTEEKLEGYNIETYRAPVEFKSLNADIFITISCIQHFPDVKFLRLFLKNLNNSGIKMLIIQVRFGRITVCHGDYENRQRIGTSCLTNEGYVSGELTHYKLLYATANCKIAESQYLLYEANSEI